MKQLIRSFFILSSLSVLFIFTFYLYWDNKGEIILKPLFISLLSTIVFVTTFVLDFILFQRKLREMIIDYLYVFVAFFTIYFIITLYSKVLYF
jgi:hypothetical protein